MIKTMRQVFRIQSAMSCNRFLFWVKKIPLVKRLFPDRLYGAVNAKRRLMAAVEILKVLYAFGGKFVYLFLCCGLPTALALEGATLTLEGATLTQGWPMLIGILFFLSFLTGAFLASDILAATLIKYTCVRQMGMDSRACVAATSGRMHALTFLSFTPALIAAAAVFAQPWWYGALLSLELAACRCLGEALHLLIFAKTGKIPSKNPWYVMVFVMVGLGLAYVPVFAELALPVDRFLLNPAVCIAILGCGAWAAAWLWSYPRYREMIVATCKPETVSTSAAKASAAQNAFRDVQMRADDLTAEDAGERIRDLKGYEYLNALFFRRHRRLLIKPVRYELIGVGVAFVGVCLASVFLKEPTAAALERLPTFLPACVFLMYFLCNTMGARMCKAMFYNCDISLLRFGWYRERKVLLHNFAIRLRQIALLNLAVAVAICFTILAGLALSGAVLSAGELIPFLLSVLFLAVLFSVHPLFMYYVFQPYTSQLAVKNPFFTWINWGMYMVCVMCMQIHQPPKFFTVLVLAVTLVYVAAALLMVWKRAPKTFRVK